MDPLPDHPNFMPPASGGAENYELTREIGDGGMASVVEALDRKLQRTVAAKLLSLDADTDSQLRDRFLGEARILAALEHPNIVPIHDIVWENGDPLFYTMKRVQGVTLQEVLRGLQEENPDTIREFPLNRLLTIFSKVCDAVAFAHSEDVLHRDLKPANIMAGRFGEVLVMDWGIARQSRRQILKTWADSPAASAAAPWRTQIGAVLGTPGYMAPEQARGESTGLDERADIYALGGILQAILTLRQPGDQGSGKRGAQAGIADGFPLRHLPSGRIPEALAAVARQALEPDPADRYSSVLDLSADIEAYRAGFATRAEHAGVRRRFGLFVRRNRLLTAFLATVLALSILFVTRLLQSEARATHSATAATLALAQARVALAEAAYRDFDSPAMLANLDAVPAEFRTSEWHYLMQQADTSTARMVTTGDDCPCGVAPHPLKPGIFAVAVSPGHIEIVDGRTGASLSRFPVSARQQAASWIHGLAYSPDGKTLLAGGFTDSSVALYDAESGDILRERPSIAITCLSFNRPGTRTLEVSDDGLAVHDAATDALLWQVPAHRFAHFTPDGNVLALTYSGVLLYDGDDGHVLRTVDPRFFVGMDAVLSPDGQTYFIAGADGRITGLRVSDGATVFDRRLSSEENVRVYLSVASDGSRLIGGLAAPGGQRTILVWDIPGGGVLQPLLGGRGPIEGICYHPLSGELLVTGPETRSWLLNGNQPRWTVPGGGKSGVFWGDDKTLLTSDVLASLDPSGSFTVLPFEYPPGLVNGPLITAAAGPAVVIADFDTFPGSFAILHGRDPSQRIVRSWEHRSGVRGVSLCANGRFASLFSSYQELLNVDCDSGDALPPCDMRDTSCLRDVCWLGPDRLAGISTVGSRGTSGTYEQLLLWAPATGEVLLTLRCTGEPEVLAAPPDGALFAEAGADKNIRIRDSRTLQIVREFRAHDQNVTALAFHPSRPILASAAADLTVRLWNPEDGRFLRELSPGPRAGFDLNFSPSGRYLACRTPEGGVRVWDLSSM